MKFKFIKTHQPEYMKELMLRWEALHKPLGMPPGSEIFPEEEESLHLVALEGKQVVGCVLFHQEEEGKGKLFQLAISPEYNGVGFTRKLLHFLEKTLMKRGIRHISLLAREDFVHFYSHMGYHAEGDTIQRFGLPHFPMKKELMEPAVRAG
jgi:predicted GNAT family N-acyltransferase